MKTKDYVNKGWFYGSCAMITALILTVGTYLSEGAVVEVDSVEELYAEFYNPDNVGDTIELAPGTYVLNLAGPNQGRLAFGPGTAAAIKGQNTYVDHDGDGVPDPLDLNMDGEPDVDDAGEKIFANPATETIIDASDLIFIPPNQNGAIDLRAPSNSIGTPQSVSYLTLRANNTFRSAIIVQGTANSTLDANITGCIIEGAHRGIQIDARGATGQNAQLNVMVEGNVIRNSGKNNLPQFVFGWGIQTLQSNTFGAKFSVNVRHNRCYQNKVNLVLESQGMTDGVTDVISQSNVYEEAVLTTPLHPTFVHILSGGIFIQVRDSTVGGATTGSIGDVIRLISNGDAILNNEGWAGVYVEGIVRTANGTEFKDNEIDIELIGTRFVAEDGLQNREARLDPGKTVEEQPMLRRDVVVVGAHTSETNLREPPPGGLTGPASDNKVKVKVKDATTSLMPTSYDNNPQPFVAIDNAPDHVEVELELEEINYIGSELLLEQQGGKGKK